MDFKKSLLTIIIFSALAVSAQTATEDGNAIPLTQYAARKMNDAAAAALQGDFCVQVTKLKPEGDHPFTQGPFVLSRHPDPSWIPAIQSGSIRISEVTFPFSPPATEDQWLRIIHALPNQPDLMKLNLGQVGKKVLVALAAILPQACARELSLDWAHCSPLTCLTASLGAVEKLYLPTEIGQSGTKQDAPLSVGGLSGMYAFAEAQDPEGPLRVINFGRCHVAFEAVELIAKLLPKVQFEFEPGCVYYGHFCRSEGKLVRVAKLEGAPPRVSMASRDGSPINLPSSTFNDVIASQFLEWAKSEGFYDRISIFHSERQWREREPNLFQKLELR